MTTVIIAIIAIGLLVFIIYGISLDQKTNEEIKQEEQKNEKAYQDLIDAYGEPTVKVFAPCYSNPISMTMRSDVNSNVFVFEQARKICLKGKIYDFSQITGYSVSVNNKIVSSNTKTSMGSAIGRAAVGGALFGGVGAIIGAGTAKEKTEFETEDKTIITIFTNSISEPSIVLDLVLPNQEEAAKIEGLLRIITTMEDNTTDFVLQEEKTE